MDPLVERITGGQTSAGPRQIAQQQSVETGLTSTTVAQPSRTGTQTPTTQQQTASANLAYAQPATQDTPQAAASTSTTTYDGPIATQSVDTGFGGVTLDLTAEKVQQTQPTTQTFSDTGEPEASDTDLDARIAGLLKTQ